MPIDPAVPFPLDRSVLQTDRNADFGRRLAVLERCQFHTSSWAPESRVWHYVAGVGEPGFVAGWANVGTADFPAARFLKTSAGEVYLTGAVVRSSGTSDVVFTLPSGHRPALPMRIVVPTDAPGGTAHLFVETDGDVRITTNLANTFFYCLDAPPFSVLV